MTRSDLSPRMRDALRAIVRGDTHAGRDATRDALRRRNLLGGTGTGVYVTPAGLEALGFTLETIRPDELRRGDKVYSQGPMGLIRGGLWTIADATPGYPSKGVTQVMFSNRVVLTYSNEVTIEVVERGPEPLQETAPEPTAPLPEPETPQEADLRGRREAWLAAHGGDRIPCVGCSGEGTVPYGDRAYPSRVVWRCIDCAERENARAARSLEDAAQEDADMRMTAALVLAELLDRAEAVAGSSDRRDIRRARVLFTAAATIEVEFDLDESSDEVVSLRAKPTSPEPAAEPEQFVTDPAAVVAPADPVQPDPEDAPRLCGLCESPLERGDDDEPCPECGVRGEGIPYAPLVEDGGPRERRVCPACLEVTDDYSGHWRAAGHYEVRPEVDGEFLVESRAQSTAAAWRMARGEQPPAGEWIA